MIDEVGSQFTHEGRGVLAPDIELFETRLPRNVLTVPAREVVKDMNLVSGAKIGLGHMRPDAPGAAGAQNAH